MRFRIPAVIAIVALSTLPAVADAQPNTLDMLLQIQKEVNNDAYFTIFDNINAGIDETGLVTLTGSVTNPYKSRRIEQRVSAVDGVIAVDNRIEVLPVSRFDDQLRYRVARSIYGHPALGQYIRTHPSIHIVVKRGHVTLTGVVNNEADETIVLLQAGHAGAFSVTNALKTSAEAQAELERL